MILRKFLTLLIILVMGVTPILSSLSVLSAASVRTSDLIGSDIPDSHVIEDVPYISQETSFYCLFACPAMAIKYNQINTSLQEVLYSSGVGYSMIYSHPSYNHVPMGGNGAAWWELDRCFLGNIYGLTYTESWIQADSNNKEEHWNIFWNLLKENISNNNPVILKADPLFLPSFKNPVLKELGLDNFNFPDNLFQIIPPNFFHVILIVGYNETSNTVLYHDAASALFSHPEEGKYASISIDTFKIAISRPSRNSTLILGAFTDKFSNPMNKTEVFITAHIRNIEKMKGNTSVYDKNLRTLNPGQYGINALKELKNHLTGLKNQLSTIRIYKFTNTYYLNPFLNKIFRFSDIFFPNIFKMSDWQAFSNYYFQLSVEKQNISQYLSDMSNKLNNTELVNLCKYESNLLKQESENWTILGDCFNKFMKKGIFISIPVALIIINKMKAVVDNIIEIQEAIIAGPFEN